MAETGEGLEEPWVGIPGEEWLGADGVVESLGWSGGSFLKMIAHLLGVDKWVGRVVGKGGREPRKSQCRS